MRERIGDEFGTGDNADRGDPGALGEGRSPAKSTRLATGIFLLFVALVAGVITAKAATGAVARSWHDCDAAGSGDFLILVVMWLPIATAATLWWGLAFILSHRLAGRVPGVIRVPATLLVCCAGSLVAVWLMMYWLHDPGGTVVVPLCPPGNVPPWWPTWLPL